MNTIETVFEHLTNKDLDPVTVFMPVEVREGEYIDFNNTTWRVHSSQWVIKTDPETFTRTVKLRVKVR